MKSILKEKGLILLGTSILAVLLFVLFNKYYNDQPNNIGLTLEIKAENVDEYQVYYDITGQKDWSEDNSIKKAYTEVSKVDKMTFNIPSDTKNIRIDLGNISENIEIKDAYLKKNGKYSLTKDRIESLIGKVNELKINYYEDNILVKTKGKDPYIELLNTQDVINSIKGNPSILTPLMALASIILGYISAYSLTEIKRVIKFLKSSIDNRKLIKTLSKNDFKNKYASSYLGIVWGFIHPLITICVYWFVFQVGFRSGDVGGAKFVLWFIAGIIPWFFFSDSLPSTTNVFLEYSYLVKKVVFKIEVLPTVKIISSLFVHLFFIIFIYVIMAVYGYYPDTYSFQFIYYSVAMIVLVFSVSILTSAVILFFRDLGQIIGIIINVGFWATPIGWQITMLPDYLARIFKLNPMYYIVTGYRDSFIDKIYFWQRPYETLYFWAFCLVVLCLGVKMFNKLKSHFSDVL